jgi:hypothetical protein
MVTVFCHLVESGLLRSAHRAVVLEVDPDAIDCIGFYPEPDTSPTSDTLGENVAGAAAYFR